MFCLLVNQNFMKSKLQFITWSLWHTDHSHESFLDIVNVKQNTRKAVPAMYSSLLAVHYLWTSRSFLQWTLSLK
jgi:hypothetical protein